MSAQEIGESQQVSASRRAIPAQRDGGPRANGEPPPADGPPPRPAAVRWAPFAVTTLVTVVALVASGVAIWDVVRFAGYVGWALLLPGTLVYRACRRTPHTLIEDVAFGLVLGFVLEIAAWAVWSLLGLQRWLVLWPLLVVVVFLAVPGLRRHWRPRGYRPVPVAWSWAVAGVVLFYGAYLLVNFWPFTPVATGPDQHYVIDHLYLLSLSAEAKHHFPMHSPQIAGDVLRYHWFAYAHAGIASLISGVDTPVVFFRLTMPLIGAAGVLAAAVAGWRISGRAWAGPTAAAMIFVVGEVFVGNKVTAAPFGATGSSWLSTSTGYAVPLALMLFAMVADRLGAQRADGPGAQPTDGPGVSPVSPVGPAAWPLIAVLAVGCAGAKSSVLPAVLCGIALAFVAAALFDRSRLPTIVGIGAMLAVVFVLAVVVLYGSEVNGLTWRPFAMIDWALTSDHPRPWWRDGAVYVIALGGYTTYLLLRLAGIPVLLWLRRGRLQLAEWFLLGTVAAGLGASLFLHHPAFGQAFFQMVAWPAGALLSGIGFVALVERRKVGGAWAAASVAVAALISVAVTLVLLWTGAVHPGQHWRNMLPYLRPGLALLVIGVVGVAVLFVLGRRRPRLWAVAPVAALALAMWAGLTGLPQHAHNQVTYVMNNHINQEHVPVDWVRAARWVRAHAATDDVVATNQHHLAGSDISLSYWLPAFAERRMLLGSWGYVPRSLVEAGAQGVNPAFVTYWDRDLQDANDLMFSDPGTDRADRLRALGVRWLVVNRESGPVSADLGRFATHRLTSGPIDVYQLG